MAHRSRPPSRSPSFIMVGKEEEDDESINCFNILTTLGIPILYAISAACMIIGITCMAIITGYWADMIPPQCFLYSETPYAGGLMYTFGTDLTACNWVAYGAIPSVVICIICGILYLFHMKDDKDIDAISLGVMFSIIIATIIMLAVACTLTEGLRVTCASVSLTSSNNRGYSCEDKINMRDDAYNLPVETYDMISVSMAMYWIATALLILISIFHVVLVIRRRARRVYD